MPVTAMGLNARAGGDNGVNGFKAISLLPVRMFARFCAEEVIFQKPPGWRFLSPAPALWRCQLRYLLPRRTKRDILTELINRRTMVTSLVLQHFALRLGNGP